MRLRGDVLGYALDLLTVVQHVATRLHDAGEGASLSVEELASSYKHAGADLGRVKLHEGIESDAAALQWMVRRATDALGPERVRVEDGRVTLLVPFENLRYQGRKFGFLRDVHEHLRNPFGPQGGAFLENIRDTRHEKADDLSELRESMREFGWLPQFPAIVDERKVVIVGHRRMRVAEELGIPPVVSAMTFGDGDAADAHRIALALASNLGAKPMNKADRVKVAEYLYGERDWTMARIAEALRVSQPTISDYLRGFIGPDKPDRPKGGRPKAARPKGRAVFSPEKEAELVREVLDEGKSIVGAARGAGWEDKDKNHVAPQSLRSAVARERSRRAATPAKCPTCGTTFVN